ncbi:MAG: hypothetical protein ACLT40_07920 [Fusobacterium sp.]
MAKKNMVQLFTIYFFEDEYEYVKDIFEKIMFIESSNKGITLFNLFYKYWKENNIKNIFEKNILNNLENKKKLYGFIYSKEKVIVIEEVEKFLKNKNFQRKTIFLEILQYYILTEHNLLIEKPIIFGNEYEEFLIKNTNKEQREDFVKKLIKYYFCEDINLNKLKKMLQKYIDGTQELDYITNKYYKSLIKNR